VPLTLRLAGREHQLEIVARLPDLLVRLDGRLHVIGPLVRAVAGDSIVIDDRPVAFQSASEGSLVHLRHAGRSFRVEIPDPRDLAAGGAARGDEITADMPGVVLRLAKAEGDSVAPGEIVLTIESMKLQMNLTAPRAGRIARVVVGPNETFDKGATLVQLEPVAGD
jgi:biotin carboxyl carrier protein